MAFPRVGLLMVMANMAAFLPEVRGKMAPEFFCWGRLLPHPSCLLACDIVGSCGCVLPLRLAAALGQLRRLPCSEPHLCAVREARALR
ncbi:hypothetical protein HPB50_007754 [Hyalomma asiaticum]|uniref:Uncharacterized protein n=1 Tax=Hyalomma asiaticum TaxID=266040 RepID=A0ACB7TIU6_HYAAI|nr:hypothetical protein HPB50_007754 [Hyalomma asiaticum]